MEKYKFSIKLEEVKKVEREGDLFKATTPAEFTYCATCDAPFFENMDVALVGDGNAGLETVLQLIKIASRVYLIEITSQLKADRILGKKQRNRTNWKF